MAAAEGAYRLGAAEDPPSVDWPSEDRIQVFEVLAAYVRRSSRHPSIGPPGDSSLAARLPDVQAAVTVLARRAVRAGDPPLDLSGSLLPEARLAGARLAGARVSAATRWPSGFDWRAAGARPGHRLPGLRALRPGGPRAGRRPGGPGP